MTVLSPRALARPLIASGLALAALTAAAPAQAATAPRIEKGTWQVKMTITAETNTVNTVGQSATKPWIFTPQCATGGCKTVLDRQRMTSTAYTRYVLTPALVDGKWRYKGASSSMTDCFNSDGSLRLADAYATREAVVLVPDKVVEGTVTRFTGRYTLALVPTEAAKAKGCNAGSAKATFVSVATP